MLFKYNDLEGNSRSINLPINKEEFDEVKLEVKNSKLEDIAYYWKFWEIRDYLFKTLIIDGFKDVTLEFLEKIHLNKFEFNEQFIGSEIKIVDLYYHFYYGESIYLFTEPSYLFYPDDIVKDRIDVHLEYDTQQLENILEQILDAFEVSYVSFKEDEELSEDELEMGDLFYNFISECWLIVKKEKESDVIGLLSYATGGGGCIDLDNGNDIEDTPGGIKSYIEKRRISRD